MKFEVGIDMNVVLKSTVIENDFAVFETWEEAFAFFTKMVEDSEVDWNSAEYADKVGQRLEVWVEDEKATSNGGWNYWLDEATLAI
jgi:hypothetical protein